MPFLNQRKGENDRRKYFINLHERILPTSAGFEPATSSRTAHPAESPRPTFVLVYILLYILKIQLSISRGLASFFVFFLFFFFQSINVSEK